MSRGSKKCPQGCTCGRHKPRSREYRELLSERTREQWRDPVVREARSRGIKEAFQDPEVLASHSVIMKEIQSRPEVKSKITGRPRTGAGCWATQSEEYYNLREVSGSVHCDICGLPQYSNSLKRHHVDHDHETGSIRGILCSRCNGALGHLEKNRISHGTTSWLEDYNNEVAAYLNKEVV